MQANPARAASRPISIALVNNMPDAAFVDTEQQFARAVGAGGHDSLGELALYTMPGLQRSQQVTHEIRTRYLGLDELYENPPDCVIITGTEPAQARLPYEAYWPHLSQLLQWAADAVPTTLLSCLAAHASLLMFDGIERRPLPSKCSGVFDTSVTRSSADCLTEELPETVPVPHSRLNDTSTQALIDAGYRILLASDSEDPAHGGWSVAARAQGSGTFVLCQGHLEYSTESLLREYRRDVRRFLFGRGVVPYPEVPSGYFSPSAIATLEAFKHEAMVPGFDPVNLYRAFPYDELEASIANTWASSSATFYSNWIGLAQARITTPN